jgi:hypothetical protein
MGVIGFLENRLYTGKRTIEDCESNFSVMSFARNHDYIGETTYRENESGFAWLEDRKPVTNVPLVVSRDGAFGVG